ncbi:MAG: phosphate ABC transporter permease PstA [Nitrososphaeraceae archaeon]|jgi:phosphate transport system permease protein|nr:phosphate ABC transporter permease PstA [Nitrososphaeraceae archaeon]MDW0141331.1 phosphate ABC transporter permease PstA [Nitrososphaeraceae archaeon]
MNNTENSPHNNIDHRKVIHEAIVRKNYKRKIVNRVFTGATIACVMIAMIPLGSILFEVVKNGISAISIEFLTQPQGSIIRGDGGVGPAIQGTLLTVGYASLIGVPIGILAGVYLSEYAGNSKFAYTVRFFNNVMTGIPSIVIGIVGYIVLVITIGSFNITAGAVALSIIMIPIVVAVTEETLKLVPNSIREAAHSLGIPKWKVTLFITLRSAKNGVLTGIVLAVSRVAGETAPLIMTILGTSLFFQGFLSPVDALPLRIWRFASQPYEHAHSFGWGAALVLIIMVLSLSILLRFLVLEKSFKSGSLVKM